MRETADRPLSFCGKPVEEAEVALIAQVIERYPRLRRTELTNSVCELLGWQRPNGGLKSIECRQFLEGLATQLLVELPQRRAGRPRGSETQVARTASGIWGEPLEGVLGEYPGVSLTLVSNAEERALWRELVERYHYLDHRAPFGAHLRYLIRIEDQHRTVVGCVQYPSGARRMEARARWIGWSEAQRKAHMQRVVNNSGFLILPWVRIRHLASQVLSRAARGLPADWEVRFGLRPWLLETLVDPARFSGTCYQAANWVEVGVTTGRGRHDSGHRRHGAAPKTVWLYPLRGDARQRRCRVD